MEVKVKFDLDDSDDKELHEKFFKQVHQGDTVEEGGPDYLTALQDFDDYLEEGEDDPKNGKFYAKVRKKFQEVLTDNNVDLDSI